MGRVITPLTQMGAHITSVNGDLCAPLKIEPGTLHGIDYTSPVASAQVNLPYFLQDFMQMARLLLQNRLCPEITQN